MERLSGLIKRATYKTIGKTSLTWYELEKVLMEVEITMNYRLFSYVERDIQTPILTPNTMIHGIAISELEEDVSSIAVKDVKKKS